MTRVFFTEDAYADVEEAVGWYEAHAPDVLRDFREALRAVVARIAVNPKHFRASPYHTRSARLRRFPYLVIFRETETGLYVVAVFHTSRSPASWESRMS